jgi:sirohydrochlorin ferrochelatase
MEAIIYIAHGSRRSAANQKFISFINEAMKQSTFEIQAYGFLEHAEPSILQAIEACVQKGADRIIVVPVLLLPGVHTNVDIPGEIQKGEKLYPDIPFFYQAPLGSDKVMVNILYERLISQGFMQGKDEAVLLVGHGSRDPDSSGELQKLASLLSNEINLEVHTAYLTTSVFYHEKVEELRSRSYEKIYVLPFLLFTGGFAAKMEMNNENIIVCDPIGFDDKLIPLIHKRTNLG